VVRRKVRPHLDLDLAAIREIQEQVVGGIRGNVRRCEDARLNRRDSLRRRLGGNERKRCQRKQ